MKTTMIIIALVLYIGMMIGIGIRTAKRNKNSEDFYLGGRQLGPFTTAMSAEASDMSAYLLMGVPGLALMTGLAEAVWTAIGLTVGTYLNWLFVAKRLRVYSEHVNAMTVPEFFSNRFGDKKHVLSCVAAIIIIIFFIPYTASGFSACGKLFGTLFGMDYMTAMIISAIIIVTYCALGGFLAASTTDLIQSIVMTISLFIVLGVAEGISGGFDSILSNAQNMEGYLDLFKGFNVATGETGTYGAFAIATTLAWGLGYFGMPHILLRFMGTKDPNQLKLSRRIASSWCGISMLIAVMIGVSGLALMQKGVVGPYASSSEAETIIVDISKLLATTGYIPAFAAGIFLSGILASTMSTADSQLITASSAITQDLLVNTLHMNISEKQKMVIARVSVIIIAIIAIFLARNPNGSVFRIVSFAWAGFGAAFGPLMVLGLFWKRMNKQGALCGMIAGGAMVFIWKFGIAPMGGVLAIYELLPAFIFNMVVAVIVSLVTKAPEDDIVKAFDQVQKKLAK